MVEWVDGSLTCSCRAFRYGDGPCKHIEWLRDRDKLPSKPQQSLSEALLGKGSDDQDPEKEGAPDAESMECFPPVDGSAFPMQLSSFLSGLSKVIAEYRHGGDWPEGFSPIVRVIERSPRMGLVRVSWTSAEGSGYTDLPEEGMIEHREWRGERTQRTVMGAGGQLWVDGDKVVFVTKSGETMDENQWLDWREDQDHR